MDLPLFDKPGLWNATAVATSATTSPKTLQTEGREQLLLTFTPLGSLPRPLKYRCSSAYARKINETHSHPSDLQL
jgi:hypothetical protein